MTWVIHPRCPAARPTSANTLKINLARKLGLATGNAASIATCVLVPLIGITARINGEERELTASLPGYRDYIQGRPRLIPHICLPERASRR